jgi:RNA polymerase sigma-70 factor (ECF subfamily)
MGGVVSDASTFPGLAQVASPDLTEVVSRAYLRHRDEVYRLALRFGAGRQAWAEDVTQDVFVSLCRFADGISHDPENPDDLRPWLYRVTANRCIQKIRRERVRNAPGVRWLLGRLRPSEPDVDETAIHREDLRTVMQALEELPAKERVVFSMYYLDDMDMPEIGAMLGHSKGYICKLIHRARARIEAAGWEVEHD